MVNRSTTHPLAPSLPKERGGITFTVICPFSSQEKGVGDEFKCPNIYF
jgi:hypothetical protein